MGCICDLLCNIGTTTASKSCAMVLQLFSILQRLLKTRNLSSRSTCIFTWVGWSWD